MIPVARFLPLEGTTKDAKDAKERSDRRWRFAGLCWVIVVNTIVTLAIVRGWVWLAGEMIAELGK